MRRLRLLLLSVSALLACTAPAYAEPTHVDVRVLARGAKFLPGHQAVSVTLRDAETGEVLARGWTRGGTGDTARILDVARGAARTRPGDGAAVFSASLDLDRPRLVALEVAGAEGGPMAAGRLVSTQWILPGRHVTQGDGWVVEMPGLIVDLSTPVAHTFANAGEPIPLLAGVTMMCGCGLESGGTWNADQVTVEAWIYRDGEPPEVVPLAFAGQASRFAAAYAPASPGLYEIEIRAWAPAWNNAGVARTSIFVR
jgi:hypothetical protein